MSHCFDSAEFESRELESHDMPYGKSGAQLIPSHNSVTVKHVLRFTSMDQMFLSQTHDDNSNRTAVGNSPL